MASNPAVARAPRLDATDLASIYRLAASDFAQVNALIPTQLASEVALVEQIGAYIVNSGGKRLRPLIVLLTARCCGYDASEHIRLAAIIEFLHTATLLHDDVVDGSHLRRGRATANVTWGNAPSVLVGDFLYSRAFQLMVDLDNMDVMAIVADATNVIAEGEVLQLDHIGNAAYEESDYMEVILRKTALLFQAAAHTAAVLATRDAETIQAMRTYGRDFGLAYQLVDDWLDYEGDSDVMGKNIGDDLAEGKATLPLIRTMKFGSPHTAPHPHHEVRLPPGCRRSPPSCATPSRPAAPTPSPRCGPPCAAPAHSTTRATEPWNSPPAPPTRLRSCQTTSTARHSRRSPALRSRGCGDVLSALSHGAGKNWMSQFTRPWPTRPEARVLAAAPNPGDPGCSETGLASPYRAKCVSESK